MDFEYSTGFSHQVFSHPTFKGFSPSLPLCIHDQRTECDYVGGDSILAKKISYCPCPYSPIPRLLQQRFRSPEERRGVETDYQPSEIKHIHSMSTFQNGKHPQPERRVEERGFTVQDRPAYLTVPMAQIHQKYLRFQWQGKVYEFKSLPFGLAPAPLVFTKLLRPVVASLRQQGVRLVIYLDDILVMAESRDLLQQHVCLTSSVLTNLGFLLNTKKCVLTPCMQMEYLGFMVNSLTVSPLRSSRKRYQNQEGMSSPAKQEESLG